MKNTHLIIYLFSVLLINGCTTDKTSQTPKKTVITKKYDTWTLLGKGVEYIEMDAPVKSFLGDSKLSILRLQPELLEFSMYNASQYKRKLTVKQWADTFDLNIVLNAGMYELMDGLTHRGFSRNGNHYNNKEFNPDYNSMIAFSPKDPSKRAFDIHDLQCERWDDIKSLYTCYAQGMRMIDCNGESIGWNKRNQSCSMLVAAKDRQGRIWFIFTRSPYPQNEMIRFMKGFKEDLRNAIYLEGGPETSLFVAIGEHRIEKVGSYVSDTYPKDTNVDFWPLPNVIGIKIKE
ncbi:MAG: phosphodiester glycosidase family protein [Bacteroidota bacterium]